MVLSGKSESKSNHKDQLAVLEVDGNSNAYWTVTCDRLVEMENSTCLVVRDTKRFLEGVDQPLTAMIQSIYADSAG